MSTKRWRLPTASNRCGAKATVTAIRPSSALVTSGSPRLGSDLECLGVPVLLLGNLFARAEVKDLLSLLSLLTDRWATGLVRIGTWPEFQMTMPDVGKRYERPTFLSVR